MYCSACASPVTAGLKFCNRCGMSLIRDRGQTESSLGGGIIAAIVMVALLGLGIMFGGAIALKKGGDMPNDIVGLFMLFSLAIIGLTEIFLLRQLARAQGTNQRSHAGESTPPLFQPAQSVPPRDLYAMRDTAEPITSVTENTTRTLENSIREIRGR